MDKNEYREKSLPCLANEICSGGYPLSVTEAIHVRPGFLLSFLKKASDCLVLCDFCINTHTHTHILSRVKLQIIF